MTEIIKQLEKEILQQREDEQRILNEIAAVTSLDFAQRAAGVLDSRKHFYSFEAYLILLENLKVLLYAGMPDDLALEIVQCRYNNVLMRLGIGAGTFNRVSEEPRIDQTAATGKDTIIII